MAQEVQVLGIGDSMVDMVTERVVQETIELVLMVVPRTQGIRPVNLLVEQGSMEQGLMPPVEPDLRLPT